MKLIINKLAFNYNSIAALKDVDLEFLAKQFNITGGDIRNIVVASAFLAAEDSSDIKMRHIIHATMREYQKNGLPISKSVFGK